MLKTASYCKVGDTIEFVQQVDRTEHLHPLAIITKGTRGIVEEVGNRSVLVQTNQTYIRLYNEPACATACSMEAIRLTRFARFAGGPLEPEVHVFTGDPDPFLDDVNPKQAAKLSKLWPEKPFL